MAQTPRKNKSLTTEELAKEALAFVDECGTDALSFRKLSERTGMPTMTIMNRFDSKYELLKATLGAMLNETEVEIIDGETWQNSLRRIAQQNRRMALKHPNAFPLFVFIPIFESPVLEFTDKVIGTHVSQDLPEELPAAFLSLMHPFLSGFQLAETYANKDRDREDISPDALRRFDLFNEENFKRNVEIIIEGLAVHFNLPPE